MQRRQPARIGDVDVGLLLQEKLDNVFVPTPDGTVQRGAALGACPIKNKQPFRLLPEEERGAEVRFLF